MAAPPCLRHVLGALCLSARSTRFLRLPVGGFRDPDLLTVVERVGRIGDNPLVLAEAAGDFDLCPEVARDMYFLEGDAVVNPDDCNLRGVVAIQQRASRDCQPLRVGRDFKMDSSEGAGSEEPSLVVGDQLDQQGARLLIDGV